jgi:RNA polymerase sigma-70 factor (ECF subfamily)
MTGPGSQASFDRLVRPHSDRLYRLAWRLCSQRSEAEDLFQEILVKAWLSLEDLERIDEPGPWLSRMMYNLFIDDRRRYARQRLVVVDESALGEEGFAGVPGREDPVAASDRVQVTERLESAIAELHEDHRIVLLLHDADGYKLTEIQELTGTPVGTIKSRLHRARAKLRKILEQDGTL